MKLSMKPSRFLLTLTLFTLGLLISPIISAQDSEGTSIRVGSKNFPENAILGQMIILTLQNADFTTVDLTNLGNTTANRQALLNGQIDVYPEYTGTAYANFFVDVAWLGYDEATVSDGAATHAMVGMMDSVMYDLVWLTPAPANNTFAIALTRAFAEQHQIKNMTDFAAYVNGGGEIKLVTDEAFSARPDGLTAFEKKYGFNLSGGQLIVISETDSTVTQEALRQGVNGINAGMAFGTDGTLDSYDLIALEDDQGALPVYQPAPVFRGAIVREHPEIAGLLHPIFLSLDAPTLRRLNGQVQVEGRTADEVAESYLKEKGFLPS
jgi:osmoprotectant transport system substrate-binding protein